MTVAIVLSLLSGFYLDLLWFREVRFSSVFWSVFWSKILLGIIFGLLFFVLLFVNLLIVRRLAPRFRPFSPEQEVIERYRTAVEPYASRVIPIFSAVIALFVGIAASAQWQTFLLWKSVGPVRFGAEFEEAVFGRDPSFYIFVLPFQKFIQGWLFSALVGITVIVGVAHYLSGGIRLQTVGEKVIPQVKAHLSVLLGAIILVKAWGYWLGRFDLLLSPRGTVQGASYTDVNVQRPALYVLMWIAVICSVLFFVNIRLRGWGLPVLGIGLLALASIVVGAVAPAFVQRFRVKPQEFQREQPFITRNIEGTRQAFGLDRVRHTTTQVDPQLSLEEVTANKATTDNIRLWAPEVIRLAYENLQRIQPYYDFSDVDVDRYPIAGERRLVMLSVREVRQGQIPGGGGTWQNRHLFYTHGYGAVASPVNTVTPEGQPVFALKDIPPSAQSGIRLSPTGAQIYYAEQTDTPYVAVATDSDELDYPNPAGEGAVRTRYRGEGGIELGGWIRRLLFAYRYRDINLLISGLIDGNSKILVNRDLQTRIRKAAPFLQYDGDPYPAIVNGRIFYIQDAYTTTNVYPYSQRINLNVATGGDLTGQANYIRNSVKVVVDAYHGTVKFYVVDPTDPLIRVWIRAFPELFTTTPAPRELQDHFRYPEDLLLVQSQQYVNYHVTDPETFYNKGRFWSLPVDPRGGGDTLMRPYYVLLKLPGQEGERFVLFTPFTPANRPNMVAYMAAMSDPGEFGQLRAFEFPVGVNIDGPQQVFARVNADPAFSRDRTLLGQGGSRVTFGDLLVVPIEDSFLYVVPVFVQSAQSAIPELKRVLLVQGGTVTMANSLPEALEAAFGEAAPTRQEPGAERAPPEAVEQLLAQALDHFRRADQLLREGDLAGYQREINRARALVQQANAAGGGGGVAPVPSPSPSPRR